MAAEHLQGLVLRRGCEGEVAGVGQHLPRLDDAVDLSSVVSFILSSRLGQCHAHCGSCTAALAGMGFVNDDGELPAPMLLSDLVKDEGERLHCGDDYLLAALYELASCRFRLASLLHAR